MKDPYVNEDGVLINKLNITNYQELNQAEADIGFLKLINVDSVPLEYFDENLIRRIHKHIFEDIFTWAGEYRIVPLVKEELVLPGYSIPYSDHRNIARDLKTKLQELNGISWKQMTKQEIASVFARKIALLWKVHPFRDGNTRTILSFSYLYAKEHGFPLDMKTFTENLSRRYTDEGRVSRYSIRDKFALASLDDKDYPEVDPLAKVFEEAMENYGEKESKFHK